jgi:hypothetical protein
MRGAALAALLLLLPASAAASGAVSLELAGGSVDLPPLAVAPGETPPAPEKSPYLSATLLGDVDLVSDALILGFAFSTLRDEGSTPRFQGALALDWLPAENWNLGLTLLGSPRRNSTYPLLSESQTAVAAQGATIQAQDSTLGATLSAGYDSMGGGAFDTAVGATVGLTRFNVQQQVRGPLGRVLATFNDRVQQLKLGLSFTETILRHNDLTLRGALYLYDKSPLAAGFLRVERLAIDIGTGVPVAPLRWELRPAYLRRFGRSWTAGLQLGFGGYVDRGSLWSATLKASWRPVDALKLFASLSLQRDVDPPGSTPLLSRFGSLGAEWRF